MANFSWTAFAFALLITGSLVGPAAVPAEAQGYQEAATTEGEAIGMMTTVTRGEVPGSGSSSGVVTATVTGDAHG